MRSGKFGFLGALVVELALPTVIGEPFGGGFYIGDIEIADGGSDDGLYLVVMGGPGSQGYLAWKASSNTGTPGTNSVADGMANTLAMQSNNSGVHHAGMYCLNYQGGGHGDWYLPSRNELDLSWINRSLLPGLEMEDDYYWSSTQSSNANAWSQDFTNGTQSSFPKEWIIRIRPVRRIKRP